jgi:hypothetical protein
VRIFGGLGPFPGTTGKYPKKVIYSRAIPGIEQQSQTPQVITLPDEASRERIAEKNESCTLTREPHGRVTDQRPVANPPPPIPMFDLAPSELTGKSRL